MNKHEKETVANKVLEHKYAKREAQLRERIGALASSIYEREHREFLRKTASLPEAWFFKSKGPTIYLNRGGVLFMSFTGRFDSYQAPELHPVPYGKRNQYIRTDEDTARRAEALYEEHKELYEERKRDKEALIGALGVTSSPRKLLELWPELEPFIGIIPTKGPSRALTLPRDSLNARFGLPVEEQASV